MALSDNPGWALRWRSPLLAGALAASFAVSCTGIALSLWAHLEALFGTDPERLVPLFWALQLVLLGLLLPITIELVVHRSFGDLLRCSRPLKVALFGLLAYYGLNFYVFLYWSVDHLTSSATWRMISSGWLLLFSVAAVYYLARLNQAK